MRKHLWMHGGLAVVMVGILGLDALGVAVPIGVVYVVLLVCPLMMASMMLHGHDHVPRDRSAKSGMSDGGPSSGVSADQAARPHEVA